MTAAGIMAAKALSQQNHPIELADVFRLYGQTYCHSHPLPFSHIKVMRAVENCRTAALGGHVDICSHCGFERISYNSCRNRHCPKCQAMAKANWLENRKAELLPVGYFHTIFTIPHELNPITLCNKKVFFDILFDSVAQTLHEFAVDTKHKLGGKLGFTAILHTWDQRLLDHFHLHCVIPSGVISHDNTRWINARDDFLFSVKALSIVFRGKFIDTLKNAYNNNELIFPGRSEIFAKPQHFRKLVDQLYKKDWVVYSKKPFAGAKQVLDYLGRYTHRVAISNHRIKSIANGTVSFTYRDRSDGNKTKLMTLGAHEFIRRFLLHVLPQSYKRIRHFGFLASRCKKKSLTHIRKILNNKQKPSGPVKEDARTMFLRLTGIDLDKCPHCKHGTMCVSVQLPRMQTNKFPVTKLDSS
jgi:predicted Zn-ribbon and HTH transcriptional regulator